MNIYELLVFARDGGDHCIKFSILEDQKLPEAAPGLSPFQISLEIKGSHEQNQLLESAIGLIPEFRDSLSSAFPLSFFFCFYQPQKVILVRPLALAQSTQHFEEIFRDLSPRGDKGGPLFAQVNNRRAQHQQPVSILPLGSETWGSWTLDPRSQPFRCYRCRARQDC